MDNYQKFKHLLEYFVAHMEWVVTHDTSHIGYDRYIKGISGFKASGQGHKGHDIQKQITQWDTYDGNTICINVYAAGFKSKGSYLNWKGTWENIKPMWDGDHIKKLYISTDDNAQAKPEYVRTIAELGLFDDGNPNVILKKFFDKYQQIHLGMSDLESTCINLLKNNRNLILTGAPGTGKTFLAKKIAKALGATTDNGQCQMVQFHPSMDYSDFVEGLRPVRGNNDTDISFERRNGIFKDFCAKALRNLEDSAKTPAERRAEKTIEECYQQLVDDISDGIVESIPFRTGSTSMVPTVSAQGNVVFGKPGADKSQSNPNAISLNRIKKLASVFKNIDALNNMKNLTDEIRDAIGGCNTSGYWAVLAFIYNNYYTHITPETKQVSRKNFVFIIDEINRGEFSKILGELFFCIDPGYRGSAGTINTQYQNLIEPGDDFEHGFYVPDNVYIIGTMNDIDRSVESMDFAMRRRFAWKEITVESQMSILDDDNAWTDGAKPDSTILDELKTRMTNLNDAIIDKYHGESLSAHERIGLSSAYQIGPAYFLKYALYDNFDDLWEYHLKGLLYEYLRGAVNIEAKMKKLYQAYSDTSKA